MLTAEIQKIIGRKGSFFSAMAIGLAMVITVIIVRATQSGDTGGSDLLNAADAISLPATIMAVIVGALAGSYDSSQGTMRYLVMTGVPRTRLFVTRALGTAIATVVCCVPAIVALIIGAFVLHHSSATALSASFILGGIWAYLGNPLVFALVSVGIGSLLNSNGAAIGISLGLALGGAVVTGLVSNYVSATVAAYLITESADIFASLNRNSDIPLYAATIATLVWLVAFLGAGMWRTLHDEY